MIGGFSATSLTTLSERQLRFDMALMYTEIGIICTVILLYLLIKLISTVILIPNKVYIYTMIASLFVMIISDNVWKWIDAGFLQPSIRLAYLINGAYFVALDVFLYFVIFYFKDSKIRRTYEDLKINISRIRFESKMIIANIFIVHILTNMANPITHWFFYIGEDLSYNYGKFYAFEYIIPYGVMLVYTFVLMVDWVKANKALGKVTILDKPSHIILYQLIPSAMGLIGFQITYLPLFTVGMTLFLVALYVRMVEYFVRIDPVTQMHTRRSIIKIFQERVKEHEIDFKPLTICMFSITNYYDLNELDGVAQLNSIIMKITDTFKETNAKYQQYAPEVSRLDSVNFLIVISTDERAILDAYKKDLLDNFKELKKDLGEIELQVTYTYIRYNDSMKASEILDNLQEKIKEYKAKNRSTYVI